MAVGFPRASNVREYERKHLKQKPWSFYKANLGIDNLPLCHILSVRSESLDLVYTQGEKISQGYGYQEARIMGRSG
jgi:hypothetical protein